MAEPRQFPPLYGGQQFFSLAYYYAVDGVSYKLVGLPFPPRDPKQAPEALHFEGFYSLFFLPATPSSQTLEGLFELTQRPSQGLDWPCALLLELQRNKANIGCVALGAEVPGHFKNN